MSAPFTKRSTRVTSRSSDAFTSTATMPLTRSLGKGDEIETTGAVESDVLVVPTSATAALATTRPYPKRPSFPKEPRSTTLENSALSSWLGVSERLTLSIRAYTAAVIGAEKEVPDAEP